MTKKLNLSIPDELAEKIEARREYLGNLSALFHEAVREKIRKKEEFEQRMKGDMDIGAVIERLKQEKLELEGNYREQGQKAGYTWAKAASYAELKYAGDPDTYSDTFSFALEQRLHGGYADHDFDDFLLDRRLGEYFREILKTSPPISPVAEGSKPIDRFPPQWLRGWREAVGNFWQEIQDKL